MADALFGVLLERLNLLIQKEIGLIWGVDKEMRKLSSLLSTIHAVIEDAEENQITNRALQNWFRKLKDAAYKVDDILDECATEAAVRFESYGQNSSLINKVLTSRLTPYDLLFRRKIGSRMRDIIERLDDIADERSKFHLIERGSDDHSVGLGGLGETTLAQMVFKRQRRRNIVMSFVITNLVLELVSAVLDQVSSYFNKTQCALFGMVISFAAMLTCIVELIYEVQTEKLIWRRRSSNLPFPWYYYRDQGQKPFGTFKDIVGLVCALCQCVVAIVNYCFLRRNADNPIRISIFPIIFALGILFSQILKNQDVKKPLGENETHALNGIVIEH